MTVAVGRAAEVDAIISASATSSAAPSVPASAAAEGRLPDAVLGMIIFLVTEVMLFSGLISAHIVLRGPAVVWPPMGQPRLPIEVTAINTCFLLFSAYTMLSAVDAFSKEKATRAKALLSQTLGLGLLFVAVQGYEWVRLISFGLTTRSGLYGALFYTVVGVHAAHVLGAVSGLAWVRARPTQATISAIRLYWLFVVAVWPILFVLVYLW
jgi:cytochrome c oxidase subunit III